MLLHIRCAAWTFGLRDDRGGDVGRDALLGMLLPAVNSLIFGPVVDSGNVGVVVPIAVLLASVTCARVLIGGAKELVMSRVGTKLSLSVQAAAMMRTLSLPAPFYRARTHRAICPHASRVSRRWRACCRTSS